MASSATTFPASPISVRDISTMSLSTLFAEAMYWQSVDKDEVSDQELARKLDENDQVYQPVFEYETLQPRYITSDDLSHMDERLPQVLDDLLQGANMAGREQLQLVLNFFCHGALQFPEDALVFPNASNIRYQIAELQGVHLIPAVDNGLAWVNIDCVVYVFQQVKRGGAYPVSTTTATLGVKPGWLDVYYPTWRARLDTALALGMACDLRGAYVFSRDPAPTMSAVLPDTLDQI